MVSLWRYPVKSMIGEEFNPPTSRRPACSVIVLTPSSTAPMGGRQRKNPRKWPHLFDFRAPCRPAAARREVPAVRITLPDGTIVTSDQGDLNQIL